MLYLETIDAALKLKNAKAIEQWLTPTIVAGHTIINWVRIDKENDGTFSVTFFQSYDEGSPEFLDIYEFSTVDSDLPYGLISNFLDVDMAIEYAIKEYSCSRDKFVNSGLIQELYAHYLLQRD